MIDIKNVLYRSGRDIIGWQYPLEANERYIHTSLEWLKTAQDSSPDGGVSSMYSFITGWGQSYIETTGYIINSFFSAARQYGEEEYFARATQMADFLLQVQLEDGGFQSGGPETEPIIARPFNTGEDIRGLVEAYRQTRNKLYLVAACRAADWLMSIQEENGTWKKGEFLSDAHTYHSRTSWALLEVWKETNESVYKEAAVKNLDWVLKQQHSNGWFPLADFASPPNPFTHAIDYVVSGLFESGLLLQDVQYVRAAQKTADALLAYYQEYEQLPATFSQDWRSADSYACLTGNAQIAVTWFKFFTYTKESKYRQSARKLLLSLKRTVDSRTNDKKICGALAGAYPHHGGYSRFSYPNWATKFFLDACLLEQQL